MNLNEFKAWFEGFTDGIESNPTEKQWAKIKARVSEIKDTPTPPTVIREYWNRYYPHYQRYYDQWYGAGVGSATWLSSNQGSAQNAALQSINTAWTDEHQPIADTTIGLATFKAMGAADHANLQ